MLHEVLSSDVQTVLSNAWSRHICLANAISVMSLQIEILSYDLFLTQNLGFEQSFVLVCLKVASGS